MRGGVVKLVSEYLERAVHFSRLAADENDPKLRQLFEDQALAYRKLAEKRAAELNLPAVVSPKDERTSDGPPSGRAPPVVLP